VNFRDSLPARRISLVLIFTLLFELVAPALAVPWWEAKPDYPQAQNHKTRRSLRHHPQDAELAKVLKNVTNPVSKVPAFHGERPLDGLGDNESGHSPSGPNSLTGIPSSPSSQAPHSEPEPQGPTHPPEGAQPAAQEPAPGPIEASAQDEADCGCGNQTVTSGKAEAAVVMVDPRQVASPYSVSRQTYPGGPFLKPQFINGAHEVFVTDYGTHVAHPFENLSAHEVLRIEVRGPNQENNCTQGGLAGAVEYRYHHEGSSPSDLKARYQLEVHKWDARSRYGRRVFCRKEATQLCSLRVSSMFACRDTGDWHITILRNGQIVKEEYFRVFTPALAENDGLMRRTSAGFQDLDEGAAYSQDDSIHFQKTYPPEAPDQHGRQHTEVRLDFVGPSGHGLNKTRHNSVQSLSLEYESDGTNSRVVRKIWDELYPHGHVYDIQDLSGRLETLTLQGGPGLQRFGNWKVRERVNHHSRPSQTFQVRSVVARVVTPSGNIYLNNGEMAYQIQVATFPTDWNPGDMGWHLRLRNPKTGDALAEFDGVFLEDSTASVRTFIQRWDGRTDSTGERIRPGTPVVPEVSLSLLTPEAPQLEGLQAQAAQTHQTAFAVTPLTGGDRYRLETDQNNGFFLVDDDLFVYLDNDEEPVYADTDGVRTYIKPSFEARKGQSLRLIAVDSFGLCRLLEGPIYLVHETTGQRQLLRRFTLDDGCKNWPAGYAFIDISYTIQIPSGNAAAKAIFPPNNSIIANEYWNHMDQFMAGGPGSFFGLDPQTFNGAYYPTTGSSVAVVDTHNDSRGKDPYPFKGVSCTKDNEVHSSPIEVSVSYVNGHFYHRFVDLAVATRGLPLILARNYVSEREHMAPNFGWSWDFEEALLILPGAQQAILKGAAGEESLFARRSGQYVPIRPDQTDALRVIDDRHFEVTFKNHTRHLFEVPGQVDPHRGEPYRAVMKQKIDNNGNANTYTWDPSGRTCLRIEGPHPAQYFTLSWSAGKRPRLKFVKDHAGRRVCYEYTRVESPLSGLGHDYLLTRITQPGCKVFQHSYHPILGTSRYRLLDTYLNGVLQEKIAGCDDSPGTLKEVTHLLGGTMSFERVENPEEEYACTRVTKTAPDMPENTPQVTKSFLDELGRVVTQYDPDSNRNHVEFDGSSNPRIVVDPCGHETHLEFDTHRNLTQVENALSQVTKMSYINDNLVSLENALQEKNFFTWDDRNNLTGTTDNAGHVTSRTVNDLGQITSVTNSLGITWTMGYDEWGFLNSTTAPATCDGRPATQWRYVNDNLGRRLKSIDPLNRETTNRFDERDRLVEITVPAVSARFRQEAQGRRSILNEFDRNDLLRSTTGLDGLRTQYGYDKAHRLISVKTPGYKLPTRLHYDSMSNLLEMMNPAGHTTRYELDMLNRTKALVYPNGDRESFRYSHCGVLTEWNRGGQSITYDHDALDRIDALHSPSTSDELAWTFDEVGRVKTAQESSGVVTTYQYSSNNLLESALRSDGRGIHYFYDEGDRLRRTEDHEGEGTDYHLNERNEILAVDHDHRTVSYAYDLVGRLTGSRLPNGVECQRSFDERNRLLFLHYQKAGQPLLTLKYGHNQLGQRIVEEKVTPIRRKLSRFTYNQRRELVKSDRSLACGPRTVTHHAYDLNHNRIRKDETTYSHNVADQLTQSQGPDGQGSIAYNPQGQAQQAGGFDFTYNQDQQIKTALSGSVDARYFYDAGGRRMAKEVNGTRSDFLMLGGEVLKTYENGDLKAKYFLALGREGIFTDGSWKYYLSDGLGSTVALVDEDGNSIAEWDYGDYGETEQIAGDPGLYNPYLFTGQEWDSELGMYNLRARHYSPSLGRFLARDSIGYSGGSNLYAYCNGDPVNFIDPSGTLVKFSSGGQNLESFSPGFTTKWNEAVSLAQEKFALYGYSVFKGYQVIYKGDIPGQFTGLRDSQYQSDIKYEDYLTGGWDVTFTFKCGEGFASDMSGQAEAIDSHNVYIFDLALSTSAKGLANLILHELTHVGLMRKHQRSDYWNLPEFGGIGHPAKYFGQGIDAIPDGAW